MELKPKAVLNKQRLLQESLNRLLWIYSEEHGGDGEWNDIDGHWYIVLEPLDVNCDRYQKICGVVYFKDEKTARDAIREVIYPFMEKHPDW